MEGQEKVMIQDIRGKLEHGFYINNLIDMAEQFQELSLSSEWSSTCFLMNQVLLYIAQKCDVHPLLTQQVLRIETEMKPSILALLDNLENAPTAEQIKSDLDQIVTKLLGLNL